MTRRSAPGRDDPSAVSGDSAPATDQFVSATRAPPGIWRLFAPALVIWAIVSVCIVLPGTGARLAIGAALAGTIAIILTRWLTARRVLACVVLLCGFAVVLGARVDVLEAVRADPGFRSAAERGSPLELKVTLRAFPKLGTDANGRRAGWVSAAALSRGGSVPVVLWFDDPKGVEQWAPGSRLQVQGRLVVLEPGSSAAYGVRVSEAEMRSDPDGANTVHRAQAALSRWATHLRGGLRDLSAGVPGASLVPGFAVGDTSLVSEQLNADMQQSSLTHLVAVSGANCALVVSAMASVVARLGVGRRGRIIGSAVALLGFVGVVGPDASLQRAAVMAAVVLVSGYGGKRASALPCLALAILTLLIADPWQALQPGFALSVTATAGILLWAPGISRAIGRMFAVPQWVRLPVAVAIAAQFACGPLLLLVQDGFPAAGLVANVLAAPAAPWGTGLGLLAMLTAPVSSSAAAVCVWGAAIAARWIEATAAVTAALPAARWLWPGGWSGALLLGAVEALVLIVWWILRDRPGERRGRLQGLSARGSRSAGEVGREACAESRSSLASGPDPWGEVRPRPTKIRVWLAALSAAAAGVFLGPTLIVPTADQIGTPGDWSVVACDVGQGDALMLRDPAAPDAVMMVDTGDDADLLTACLDRFGIGRVAILVLSHDDRDHVGALPAIIDRVDRALVAPNNREDGGARPVVSTLSEAGVPVTAGVAGVRGALGDLRWEVLAPAPDIVPADTNAASQVLRVDAGGLTVLLLADTGETEQLALERSGAALEADVMKVAHHGSSDLDPALFARVHAEVGLISVGADNSYGHPTVSALDGLARAGTRALRTDQLGSIALSGRAGALRTWVERGK